MKKLTRKNPPSGHRLASRWWQPAALAAAAVLWCVSAAPRLRSESPAGETLASGEDKVLLVPITDPLTDSVARQIRSRIESHLEKDPTFRTVIFRVDAPGSPASGSELLAGYIFEQVRRGGRRSIAWLPLIREPLGGAILVVLACQDVAMGPDAILSAVDAPLPPGADLLGDPFRRKLEEYAHANKRPTLLAKAFIDADHDDLLRVVFRRHPDTERYRKAWQKGDLYTDFQTLSEHQKLEPPQRVHEVEGMRETVVERGSILRADADKALSNHLSDEIAADLSALRLKLLPSVDGTRIVDMEQGVLEPRYPAAQGVIDFFNHSIVRFLLILVGCLGFLLEIKMLGAFLPSLVGFGCFLTIFISSLFPVTGSAVPTGTLLDLVLFCIGIALLAVELLLLPGVAIFALGGSSLCAVSLVFAMVPPDPTALESQMNVQEAITLLIVGFGSGSIIFSALLAFLPKSTLMARRGIISRTTISAVATAESPEEAEAKRAGLVGQRGVAETVLRPAGSVLLDDGRVIDVVTEGGLIEKGTRIIVIGRSGPRTIVAPEPAEGGGAGGGGAKR